MLCAPLQRLQRVPTRYHSDPAPEMCSCCVLAARGPVLCTWLLPGEGVCHLPTSSAAPGPCLGCFSLGTLQDQ